MESIDFIDQFKLSIAARLVKFYKDYDFYDYQDNIEIGSSEDSVIKDLACTLNSDESLCSLPARLDEIISDESLSDGDKSEIQDLHKNILFLYNTRLYDQTKPAAVIRSDVDEILQNDKTFRYRLLSRMKSDCEYYLGYGGRHSRHLWSGNEKTQIMYMKVLWESFKENEKPDWLSFDQILDYEKRMVQEKAPLDKKIQSAASRTDSSHTPPTAELYK